ncbi:hypothetical protein [Rhodococcus opacus]|uniref:hypothetical protein n=1 Tax=Rhodococcus opacus TaxID=37919 RepID=UPI00352DF775
MAGRAHPRFHLHFTPTSGSWLNLVERWFAELNQRQTPSLVAPQRQALEDDVNAWIAAWNDEPKPFVWTKTADESSPVTAPERLRTLAMVAYSAASQVDSDPAGAAAVDDNEIHKADRQAQLEGRPASDASDTGSVRRQRCA